MLVYNKKQVGKNIRLQRVTHDLSIEELAHMLDLSSAFVGLIERGQRGAKIDNLVKLAEIFKVDIKELIYDQQNKLVLSENKESPRQKRLNTLFTLSYDLKENEIDFLIATTRSLKKFRSDSGKPDNDDEDVKYFNK